MRLREEPRRRRAAALLALCAVALLTWWFASGPVLLHTRILGNAEYQSCPGDVVSASGIGFTILNPFRSRAPERTSDAFLRAASTGECLPGMDSSTCRYVRERRLRGLQWRLVTRLDFDSGRRVGLFYRFTWGATGAKQNGCDIAPVYLQRTDTGWKVLINSH
jgi:hypothetical protein